MKIKYETHLDPIMQAISKYLSHSWPNEIHKVETPMHSYYKIRNELSKYEGRASKGSRIVISTALPKRMKQILHIGHLGIERTKVNARRTIYWPNINTDIENMVANCTECHIYQHKLEKETLLQYTVPEKPWTKVATDLFHCFNQNYLILVDHTSKYFEVWQIQKLSSEEVITKMKSSFSRFGIPEEIVTMGHNIHQGSLMNLLKYTTSDTWHRVLNTLKAMDLWKGQYKQWKIHWKRQTLLWRSTPNVISPKNNTKS